LFDGSRSVGDVVGDAYEAVDGIATDDEAEGSEHDEEHDQCWGDGEALMGKENS
jgi:hypothetical protein